MPTNNNLDTVPPKNSRKNVGVPKEELTLQRALIRALAQEKIQAGTTRIICPELDAYQGIADVIVAIGNGHTFFGRSLSRRDICSFNLTSARILVRLPYRKSVRISELARSTALSERTIERHLRTIEALGIVHKTPGSVSLIRSKKAPFKEIAAFEVKISDWRQGLYQAMQYKAFANRAALILPAKKARSVANTNADVFRVFGIGLAGIDHGSKLRWHVRPRRQKPRSESKALLGCFEILKRREAKALLRPEKVR